MKKLFRIIRLLWTLKQGERDAQIQRFEVLEQFLRCCNSFDHLDQFDKRCDAIILPKDKDTIRYDIMMARRFAKEKSLCRTENQRRWAAIHEGDHLLSKYKLQ